MRSVGPLIEAIRALVIVAAAVMLTSTGAGAKGELPQGLMQAYKKEYAFLKAEKKSLQKRIDDFDSESAGQLEKAEAEVNSLQSRVLRLREKADELEMSLAEAERIVMATDEDRDVLEETLGRAVETLQNEGFAVALPEKPGEKEKREETDAAPAEDAEKSSDDVEQGGDEDEDPLEEQSGLLVEDPVKQKKFIVTLFETASEAMVRGATIRREQGSFFLEDGTRTEGELVHVGRIATYGIADRAQGALAPAGSGKLKLWPVDASATARGIHAGQPPATMGIFLYESLDKGVEEETEKTVLSVIQSGKVIGWVIVVMGILGLLLILVRTGILFTVGAGSSSLSGKLVPLVQSGRIEDALAICRRSRTAAGRVLVSTLSNLGETREKLEDIISENILRESPTIERFGSTILVFAAVAPLLGLLGTVTGIISTFDVITEFGTGDPKLLSGGISEALVTTELGLIVAIPTLLLGTLLSGRAQTILGSLEKSALAVVNAARPDDVPGPSDGQPDEDPTEDEPENEEVLAEDTRPLEQPAPGAK